MENLPVQGPVFLIEVDRISPNPHQPRRDFDEEALRELANSIREFGVLQPIVVTKVEKETETGTQVEYQLIAGERRWRASQLAGLERIPAVIKSISLDRDKLELAIIENVQRANLNPMEAARAYAKLQDQFGLTQREIATRIGKSRETIANTIRLLHLPTQIQEAIAKGSVSESQARLLLSINEPGQQQRLFEELLRNNLSVRELKSRIQQTKQQTSAAGEPSVSPEIANLQKALEEFLGTRVQLETSGQTGKITIAFYSPEELQGIVNRLIQSQNQQTSQEEPFVF